MSRGYQGPGTDGSWTQEKPHGFLAQVLSSIHNIDEHGHVTCTIHLKLASPQLSVSHVKEPLILQHILLGEITYLIYVCIYAYIFDLIYTSSISLSLYLYISLSRLHLRVHCRYGIRLKEEPMRFLFNAEDLRAAFKTWLCWTFGRPWGAGSSGASLGKSFALRTETLSPVIKVKYLACEGNAQLFKWSVHMCENWSLDP